MLKYMYTNGMYIHTRTVSIYRQWRQCIDGNVQVLDIPVSQFVQHHTSQFKSAHEIFIV